MATPSLWAQSVLSSNGVSTSGYIQAAGIQGHDGTVRISTGGVSSTAYFNTTGILIAPGISLTTLDGISSTTGSFTSNLTAAAFLYTSDRTLKENLTPLSTTLDQIGTMVPYRYTYRDDPSKTPKIGLIAQDIEPILPEAVHTRADGIKTVDYPMLVPVLFKAVQDLQQEVKDLQEQVKALQSATR